MREGRQGDEASTVLRASLSNHPHLPAQQDAGRLAAPLHDALDDGLRDVHVQGARRKVVEEEERVGARGDDVVDAHGDQVDADGVVHAQVEGQLELGTDAVCAGDQEGVA